MKTAFLSLLAVAIGAAIGWGLTLREFAREERIQANTQDGQSNYQFPVVERGAVQVDAPVIAL